MCEDCLSQYSQIWHQYVIGRSLVCIFVCIFLCILVSIFVSVFVCIFVCILTHFQILIAGEFTSKQHKSWCGINNPQVAPWSSAAKSAVPLYYADRITEGGIKTLQVVPSTPADQISSALNYADRISKGGIKTLQVVSSTTADQISSAIELRRSYSRRRHQNPAGRSINHCRSDQQCNWTTQIVLPKAASKTRRSFHQTVSIRSAVQLNYADLNTWGGIKNSQIAPSNSVSQITSAQELHRFEYLGRHQKLASCSIEQLPMRSAVHMNYADLNTWGGIKNSQVAPSSSCRWFLCTSGPERSVFLPYVHSSLRTSPVTYMYMYIKNLVHSVILSVGHQNAYV